MVDSSKSVLEKEHLPKDESSHLHSGKNRKSLRKVEEMKVPFYDPLKRQNDIQNTSSTFKARPKTESCKLACELNGEKIKASLGSVPAYEMTRHLKWFFSPNKYVVSSNKKASAIRGKEIHIHDEHCIDDKHTLIHEYFHIIQQNGGYGKACDHSISGKEAEIEVEEQIKNFERGKKVTLSKTNEPFLYQTEPESETTESNIRLATKTRSDVMTKPEEDQIILFLKKHGYSQKQQRIEKNMSAETIFDAVNQILLDCDAIIQTLEKEGLDDLLKRILIQQLFLTLSQTLIALEMVPKTVDGIEFSANVAWIKSRNDFNQKLMALAKIAKNPAIASLMYEGTYYPTEFNTVTTIATNKAIGKKGKKADSADLLQFGAVCNNAAYGSVVASGTTYVYNRNVEDKRKLILGLSKSDRSPWNMYDLRGSGLGDDALVQAKQGDVIIFWNQENNRKFRQDPVKENANANHIEVVMGVNLEQNKYLLSGAHGSKKVNGIERNKENNLNWKSPSQVRGNRIIRLIPMDNDNDLVPVNLSPSMQNLSYSSEEKQNPSDRVNAKTVVKQVKQSNITIVWVTL